jgi:hypothetical protein
VIHIDMQGPSSWGTNDIPGGKRINVEDKDSGIVITVPFAGAPLAKLITELSEALTPEQKRELMPHFASGIVLPGHDGYMPGPQG